MVALHPSGKGKQVPIRELPLVGANKIPALTGTLATPLDPVFTCPFTGASSTDGEDLSEEWANGGILPPATQEPEEGEPLLLEPPGAESESGSDSSESEPGEEEADTASMNAEPPDESNGQLSLINLRSGCFHALVPCEPSDKGAMIVEVASEQHHFRTACGKQPSIQEISFKRPKYLEPCRMKCCQALLN